MISSSSCLNCRPTICYFGIQYHLLIRFDSIWFGPIKCTSIQCNMNIHSNLSQRETSEPVACFYGNGHKLCLFPLPVVNNNNRGTRFIWSDAMNLNLNLAPNLCVGFVKTHEKFPSRIIALILRSSLCCIAKEKRENILQAQEESGTFYEINL